ncbi:MAG: hypothetical protein OXC46_07135 [Thaumarchaeota archaeon]|nr:hypothetical protein [Nitrososphaerota archaeon]
MRKRNFARDIEIVKGISEKLEKRIAQDKIPQEKIDKLSSEELQDLNKIVSLADFMLCKYEDKKSMKDILESFVDIIEDACASVEGIDDEIAELLVSAEDTIGKIRCMHENISDKSDLTKTPEQEATNGKTGSKNLTNTSTVINTAQYLQNA